MVTKDLDTYHFDCMASLNCGKTQYGLHSQMRAAAPNQSIRMPPARATG